MKKFYGIFWIDVIYFISVGMIIVYTFFFSILNSINGRLLGIYHPQYSVPDLFGTWVYKSLFAVGIVLMMVNAWCILSLFIKNKNNKTVLN